MLREKERHLNVFFLSFSYSLLFLSFPLFCNRYHVFFIIILVFVIS